MSRIGKKPVPITDGAKVSVSGQDVVVEKGNAKLNFTARPEVTIKVEGEEVVVERINDSRIAKAMHGTTRTIIANMIEGVTKGFKKELEINGVGWGAQLKGRSVALSLGYAFPRIVDIPDGVDVKVEGNKVTVTGADKQKVGEVAAQMRSHRKPEPYNGKGVKYVDEVIIRKQGKAFAGGG